MFKGIINPNEIKQKTGKDEHVYWKEAFHEVYACSGVKPEELLKGLAIKQPGLDLDKTNRQLKNKKNIDYILSNSRLGREKYKLYFPNNSISIKNIQDIIGDTNKVSLEDLRKVYEEITGNRATYPKDNKEWNTNKFNKWVRNRERKAKNEDLELDPYKIAREVLKDHNILCPKEYERSFRIYKKGIWVEESNSYLDGLILEYYIKNNLNEISDGCQLTKLNMIKKYIRKERSCSILEFDTNQYLINLLNGIIDFSDLNDVKFIPHDPKYKMIRQFPIIYDKLAQCPTIDKFYSEIFHSEDILLIDEFVGLCLTTIIKFEKGMIIYGKGNNGKDTFINLLNIFLGMMNVSNVDLVELEDGFLFSRIENKTLNACPEVDCDTKLKIKRIKECLGGAIKVQVNKKFLTPYDIPFITKFLYAVNDTYPNIPKSTQKGFFRKWILTETPNMFDGIEDRDIHEKLTTEKELSGLFNRSLKGLIRLLKNNNFTEDCKSAITWQEVRTIWMDMINPFILFIKEKGEIGKYEDGNTNPMNTYWELKEDVLEAYNTWRKEQSQILAKNLNEMTRLIQQAEFKKDIRSINRKKYQIYTGFRLLEPNASSLKVINIENQYKQTKIDSKKNEIEEMNWK